MIQEKNPSNFLWLVTSKYNFSKINAICIACSTSTLTILNTHVSYVLGDLICFVCSFVQKTYLKVFNIFVNPSLYYFGFAWVSQFEKKGWESNLSSFYLCYKGSKMFSEGIYKLQYFSQSLFKVGRGYIKVWGSPRKCASPLFLGLLGAFQR